MINNLQILRGIAATLVVVFHVAVAPVELSNRTTFFSRFDNWGAIGVDIFFVISGFIMIYTQEVRPKGAVEFAWSRTKRIVPIYLLVTVVWGIVIYVTSDFDRSIANPAHIGASLIFSSVFLGFGSPFIPPGWSLEFEMMFYAIFAVSILWGRPLAVVSVALIYLVFVMDMRPIVLEFIGGMLIGRWYFIPDRVLSPSVLVIFGLAGLAYTFIADIDTYTMQGFDRAIYWGIPSMLLVAGLSCSPQLSYRFPIFLGTASYSIYLTHWCSIRLFSEFFERLDIAQVSHDLYIILCTLFCLLAGAMFHNTVEVPIANKLRFLSRKQNVHT